MKVLDTNINKLKRYAMTLIIVLGCLVQGALADNADTIASYINATAGPNLTAIASDNDVTVTGTLGATRSDMDFLTLNIDADVTVIWQATLQGTPSNSHSLINISGGSGAFWVKSGLIENTGTGRAITNNSLGVINIFGGTVKAGSSTPTINNASTGTIFVSDNALVSATGSGNTILNSGTVNVSGGTVSAINGYAISGTMNISGGTVSATTGEAISSSKTVIITGGTVSATTGKAISCSNNTVIISGGTVSATTGTAINMSGTNDSTVTISNGAKITSANTSNSSGTIFISGLSHNILNIKGGIVENTAIGTNGNAIYSYHNYGAINVSGGIVNAISGNAIHYNSASSPANSIYISGGTVSTSGTGKSAVRSNSGSVTIIGGVVSVNRDDSYAVYSESSATLTLGGSPTITGRLFTYPEKLDVFANGTNVFTPESKIYTLDFPTDQYTVSKIAVMKGKDFLKNFVLRNPDYALNVASQHLSIEKSYKISFDLNGGIGTTPFAVGVRQGGELYVKPSTSAFTKIGYVNDGNWYTTSDGSTEFVFGENGTLASENMTLYIKWTPIIYTITYDLGGGTNNLLNLENYTIENAPIIFHDPTRDNYAFDGWFDNETGGNLVTAIGAVGNMGDITLWAKWRLIYTVIFDANGGTLTHTYGATGVGGRIVSLPTPTREDYDFNGWFTERIDGIQVTANTEFNENTTIYARWVPVETSISFHKSTISNLATQIRNGINLQAKNNAVVEIFDLKGNLISQQNFDSGVNTIPFGHLTKGMYIVKVSFGSEKQILKVPMR